MPVSTRWPTVSQRNLSMPRGRWSIRSVRCLAACCPLFIDQAVGESLHMPRTAWVSIWHISITMTMTMTMTMTTTVTMTESITDYDYPLLTLVRGHGIETSILSCSTAHGKSSLYIWEYFSITAMRVHSFSSKEIGL